VSAILDNQMHSRLLDNLDELCAIANVPKAMLSQSATHYLSPVELDWLRNFRTYQSRNIGLSLTAANERSPDVKMMAMAAALMRNFVDARVLPVNTVLQIAEDGGSLDCTVLLIPNLLIRALGKALPAWKVQMLYDVLLQRFVSNRLTVVYVESMSALETEYGSVFANFLRENFVQSKGGVC